MDYQTSFAVALDEFDQPGDKTAVTYYLYMLNPQPLPR